MAVPQGVVPPGGGDSGGSRGHSVTADATTPPATQTSSPAAPPTSLSSTWIVALVVLLLSLPLGTVIDGLFSPSGNRGSSSASPVLFEQLFTPHNPLPADVGPHQVTVQLFQLNHLPGFRLVAVDYRPSLFHQALGRLLDVLSWAALALVVFVRPICAALGLTQRGGEGSAQAEQLPPWAEALENNRVTAIISAFFGAQVVRSVLIPSNAFEIYFGPNLLWSTVHNGRMPNGRDLLRELEALGVRVRDPM
ncbi:hypothetical protein NCLIV_041980 [Neospora caninum Liverpool]|uniref:Selenoprotein T n=1 Tax=Neospora caninum (strain Liverpool) TaxID=572307 RepID=F0VBY9_NEOCL|nr:hypothetical protein NCLIV_041980 [Neospora caninum Liverpool]CBZ51123.1 hypothetical protein NCLIV_041980 [Neospora caninum Liverpool]|eukprot:XP_003881156.1 hypothetical protein NCLIV_041980 [Neospora caninum Liverpool]